MSDLRAFMVENVQMAQNVLYEASPRFKDPETGKAVLWELRCMGAEEEETIRKDCTKRVPVPGRRGQYTQETDMTAYLNRVVASCVVSPDLSDASIQDSWSVMGEVALLKTMLLSGEFAALAAKVQEINGFDTTFEERVEEAKN